MGTVLFIVGLLAVAALAHLVYRRAKAQALDTERGTRDRASAASAALVCRLVSLALVLGAVATLFFSSYTIVPAKHVGVITTFGKPVDARGHGWQWHAPWSDVTTFDGTIQSMSLRGDKGDDHQVTVRLADQGTANIDVTLQWRIQVDTPADRAAVKRLYADYRDPARLDENFVERQLRSALYDAFSVFDPLIGLADDGAAARSPVQVGSDALSLLRQRINTQGIELLTLTVQGIRYDATTEKRINDRRELAAAKRNAEIQKGINEQLASANNALAAGARDQGTLYQQCLALTERMLREGKTMPPAWSCGAPPQTVLPVQ